MHSFFWVRSSVSWSESHPEPGLQAKVTHAKRKIFRNFLICRAIYGGLEDPDDLVSPTSLDPDPDSNNMDPRSTRGRKRAKFIRARRLISMAKLMYLSVVV
jgi:hypothetical protein